MVGTWRMTTLWGGNLAGELGSGAAPYLATEIKRRIGYRTIPQPTRWRTRAAQLNDPSPLAGCLGAGGGELAARVIPGNCSQERRPML
jgi:filamentous hemagglutinin